MKNAKRNRFVCNALISCAFAVSVLSAGVGVATLNDASVKMANADTTEAAIFMLDGASIRYSAPAGIRFTAYVNDDYFTDGELNSGVTVGMKVYTETDATIEDFSTDSEDITWQWAASDFAGYYKYQVVIEVPEAEYETDLTAQAYVSDGTNTETSASVTRSIARVANAALAKNVLTSELDDAKKTALQSYVTATGKNDNFSHPALENGDIVWESAWKAVGYFVKFGDEVKHVLDTDFNNKSEIYKLPLSSFTATSGTVSIMAYGDGENQTMLAGERTLNVIDVAGGVVSGVTNGMRLMANGDPAENNYVGNNYVTMNVQATAQTDGSVLVNMRSQNTNKMSIFGLALKEKLDLTNHDGLEISFKLTAGAGDFGGSSGDFGTINLKIVGTSAWSDNYGGSVGSVAVTVNGDWATLRLTNEDLKKYYSENSHQIVLCLMHNGTDNVNRWTNIYLNTVSYYDKVTDPSEIVYDNSKSIDIGASIPPTSAVLNYANNAYNNAGFHSYTLIVTKSTEKEDFELVYNRCVARGLTMRLRLKNEDCIKSEYTKDYNVFTEIFSGINFANYPAFLGFYIADEPSWFELECIENSYLPWFNKNYAGSDLEFFVNMLSDYSTGMGPLRDKNGNLVSGNLYDGVNATLTPQQKADFMTAYHNKWLNILRQVQSNPFNKYFSHDSYPLLDNQPGWLQGATDQLPTGYEYHLLETWLDRSLNIANIARDNGYKYGAYIQVFDMGNATYSNAIYRLPTTVAEIKWQAYINLALGAKRLGYFGYSAQTDGSFMTDTLGNPLPIYDLVKATNDELNLVDHVFASFETWVGLKTFTPEGAAKSAAFEAVSDKELASLTGVTSVVTNRELVVGEMIDGNGNQGYMLVGYDDPLNGNSTTVEMTFDGATGFVVYRGGERMEITNVQDGKISLTLAAGEGVFIIPV